MKDHLRKKQLLDKTLISISDLLLIFSGITFAFLYLILSYNDRAAFSDLDGIAMLKNKSALENIILFYQEWSGRWASISYFYMVLSGSNTFLGIFHWIFIYYCLILFTLIYSVHAIIRIGTEKLFNTSIDRKTALIYSLLFIACFYYSTFANIEAWWWICASFDYLQGITFLLLGIVFLLKEKKNIFHYILISLCFIYVGGGYEVYSLIVESLCISLIIYFLMKKDFAFFSFKTNIYLKGFIVAFTSLVLASIISFSAPGNQNQKRTILASDSLPNNTSIIHFPFSDEPFVLDKKYIVAIGISSLWLLLGMKIKTGNDKPENIKRIKKALIIVGFPLILSIIVTFFFQAFILGNIMDVPGRGWTFTSFALSCFSCFLFLIIGYLIHFSTLFFQFLVRIIAPSIIFIILILNLVKQYNYTTNYAKSYDQLINLLLTEKNNMKTGTLFVKDLPNSGMLMQLDIKDENATRNLVELFDLNFEIKLMK